MFDEDDDSGDISLSFPLSRSSPSNVVRTRDDKTPGPSRLPQRDISSPTPRKATDRASDFHSSGTRSAAHSTSSSSSSMSQYALAMQLDGDRARKPSQSSLLSYDSSRPQGERSGDHDGVDVQAHEDGELETPLASHSFWGDQRPSSADPTHLRRRNGEISSSSRPSTRRTSSTNTVSRSKSLQLHVRLPSVDMSQSTQPDEQTHEPFSATDVTPSNRLGWSRRPGEPRPPPLVSPTLAERMGRWIKEIVVCNFDLERGPVIERRVIGRRWGPGEKENVAFSSFPDTSLFAEGSIVFSFKIRQIPPDPSSLSLPEPPSPMPDRFESTYDALLDSKQASNGQSGSSSPRTPAPLAGQAVMSRGETAEEYRKWDERGREWLFGYVWFEQRKDGAISRGYMQKSLVILTHLPFPSLFSSILYHVAPAFFEHGYSALEAACHSIASWPDPAPDHTLELPLMSHVIHVKIPDTKETPQVGRFPLIPSPNNIFLASLPTSSPLRTFASFLPALWSLWECLVLAEPILVIAPDPRSCSEIVWWLRDLLRPIPPAGDFRPYLHIHDHDFSLLVNSNKPQPGLVVGVTNPFFRNAASHWPNVISVSSSRAPTITKRGGGHGASPSIKSEQTDGFLTRKHRSISKDRVLLKRLEALVSDGKLDDRDGNEALRTHFQQLTERMLVPLNRYFQTLVPSVPPSPLPSAAPSPNPAFLPSTPLIPHTGPGSIRPFSLPAFLNHLKKHGPNPLKFRTKGLSSKSRVENDFYASFCMSPTFAGWLSARMESLGLAVAAQSVQATGDDLTVPDLTPTKPRGGLQNGPATLVSSFDHLKITSTVGDSDEVGSEKTRSDQDTVTSDDGSTVSTEWRESEDSARVSK